MLRIRLSPVSTRGAQGAQRVRSTVRLLLVAAQVVGPTVALAAGPLPNGGQFVAGTGSITRNGATLTITQATPQAVIDWKGFSIGAGNAVTIDNPNGATLNRVTGASIARIDGKLTGAGDVYVIDPHGVVIGRTGVVTTGGRFVASTLNITNDDFMRNFPQVDLIGTSSGTVINLGKIGSSGSDVMLVASKKVVNAGEIRADNGVAELIVGQTVTIPLYDRLGYQASVQVSSGGDVVNAGMIRAAQVALVAADGNVFALAGRHRELSATGTETLNGQVLLVADHGNIEAHGTITAASGTSGQFSEVDMISDRLNAGHADVYSDTWNITMPALTIDHALGRSFSRSLSAGTGITVDTVIPLHGSGDIVVSGDVRWTGAAPLYFRTARSVLIEPGVTVANAGSATFTMAGDALAAKNGGSILNYGTLDWCRSTGIVTMYYDLDGRYVRGVQISNPAWHPAHLKGFKTQITGYGQIDDYADFNAIYENLAGNYIVNPSLSFNGTYTLRTPIGSAAHPFTGQFDGGGSVLSFAVSTSSTDPGATTGLFGVIGEKGVVRSFGLIDGSASADQGALGMIAGRNDGLVIDVSTYGAVGGGSTATGGLVGLNRGVVALSQSTYTTVSGGSATGGVVGVNDGVVLRSNAGSAVSSDRGPVGGVAGVNRGTIAQTYYEDEFSESVVSGAGTVGGLVGFNAGSVSQSFTDALTNSTRRGVSLGGIAGVNIGNISGDVYWNKDRGSATMGVGRGTATPIASGLTTAGLADPASYGPSWDFSSQGVWQSPRSYGYPVFR